jgi:hypothetical protein
VTSPTPQPGAAPSAGRAGAVAKQALGSLVVAPTGGSNKSKFGLGSLASEPVNVGGLFPVMAANPTAEDVMSAFAKSDPGTIAQIQDMLKRGGFYSTSNYNPHYGVLNPEDIAAFTKATTTAAQTGSDLNQYLTSQAKVGDYQGVAAQIQNQQKKPEVITRANPADLGALIDKEYQAIVGKKPTASERAGFISAYNAFYTQAQKDQYAAQSPAQALTPEQQTASDFYNDPLAQAATARGNLPGDPVSPGNLRLADETGQMPQPQAPDPTSLLTQAAPQVTTTDAPSPATFAENYVRNQHPAQAGAHDITGQFSNFLNILKGIQ